MVNSVSIFYDVQGPCQAWSGLERGVTGPPSKILLPGDQLPRLAKVI